MQPNKICPILEQYLAYLLTIKSRSQNTILEYRMDFLQFFRYIADQRNITEAKYEFADADFIRSIQLSDMYGFIAYHQESLHNSAGTRYRKNVPTRQFWKYLKSKANIIDNNIAEELETPRLPKRIVRCMTLEESERLPIESSSSSVRDNCIITIFRNCALRLSELAMINVEQVDSGVLTVICKGNKERKIYMTPAAKQAISKWLSIRQMMQVDTNALFISRNHNRLTTRSIQNIVKSILWLPESIQKAYPRTNFAIRQQCLCINMSILISVRYSKFLGTKALLRQKYMRTLMTISSMMPSMQIP